ncbi:hypothetical protein BK720_06565 [Bacillus thuringiensis serovar brasilensis]|nr:hypothetical protein BK720_06565 [Bacillus thuringiensis serovar brasilensis]
MEPITEKVIWGSHDGFIEDLNTNLNLIRNRIVNPNLMISYFDMGKKSVSKVAMLYLKGVASRSYHSNQNENHCNIEHPSLRFYRKISRILLLLSVPSNIKYRKTRPSHEVLTTRTYRSI